MLSRRTDPLPIDAVRDLLGLVRAMYRVEAAKPDRAAVQLAKIATVGLLLTEAIELAASSKDGTMGSYAAWKKAEDACLASCLMTKLRPHAQGTGASPPGRAKTASTVVVRPQAQDIRISNLETIVIQGGAEPPPAQPPRSDSALPRPPRGIKRSGHGGILRGQEDPPSLELHNALVRPTTLGADFADRPTAPIPALRVP